MHKRLYYIVWPGGRDGINDLYLCRGKAYASAETWSEDVDAAITLNKQEATKKASGYKNAVTIAA